MRFSVIGLGIFGSTIPKCGQELLFASCGWKLGRCRCPRTLQSPELSDKIIGTLKIQFRILIPQPETHTGLTFEATLRASSVVRKVGNMDEGLKCKAFPSNFGNIRQNYGCI
ncbi:hypothetical protein TNCV_2250811 [Trichonephila clavipes]|nr:hypothetical protein TNCV_2250811 [Trichonephila clavipes]